MRPTNRSHPHTLTAAKTGLRPFRDSHRFAPRLRPQLLADGVVAGYIHGISTRHRDADSDLRSDAHYLEADAAQAA